MTDLTEARRLTAEKFAALFADPRDAYPYVAADKREQMIEVMRQRAEAWVSSALGRPMPVIQACDDLDELRLIYQACMISPVAIREWWKAVEKARRKAEREIARQAKEGA
jgi:hypothetical protein